MKHIMRAQFYQMKHTRLLWVMVVVVTALQVLPLIGYIFNAQVSDDEISGALYTADSGAGVFMYPIFFMGVVIGLFCGQDFNDRTTNYELMGGHSRKEVYFGHLIPALAIASVSAVLFSLIPQAVIGAMYGWGEQMSFGGMVLRHLLAFFPFFRIGCELVCITFIIRNGYATMVISFLFVIFSTVMLDMGISTYLLGVTNLKQLGNYKGYSTYDVLNVNADRIYVYSSVIDRQMILYTVLSSLTFGVLFLLCGYVFFRQDDLN